MTKISDLYRERLDRLPEGKLARALIVLKPDRLRLFGQRLSAARRRELFAKRRRDTDVLAAVDSVLGEYGGRRLSLAPGGLGTITVEAPPHTLYALAKLDLVKAVLEDQKVTHPHVSRETVD
jgi:hypothetical protein